MIGNIAVNITNLTEQQSELIQRFLFEILPLVTIFTATTESLSETLFSPKKNYEKNGLEDSVLGVMPSNSAFIIDETQMNTG